MFLKFWIYELKWFIRLELRNLEPIFLKKKILEKKKVRLESEERLENDDINSKCAKIAVNIISYKKKESVWKGNI